MNRTGGPDILRQAFVCPAKKQNNLTIRIFVLFFVHENNITRIEFFSASPVLP